MIVLLVLAPLQAICLAGGDDSDEASCRPVGMNDDHQAPAGAAAQQDEPVLGIRMLGIIEQETVFVSEDRFGLCEGDPCLRRLAAAFRRSH